MITPNDFPVSQLASGKTTNLMRIVLDLYVKKSRKIFKCRSDYNQRFEREASSYYRWNAQMNGRLIDDDLNEEVEDVTSNSARRIPYYLIPDAQPWHGFRNVAFVDGLVDKLP